MDEVDAYVRASEGRGFCEALTLAQAQHHQERRGPAEIDRLRAWSREMAAAAKAAVHGAGLTLHPRVAEAHRKARG